MSQEGSLPDGYVEVGRNGWIGLRATMGDDLFPARMARTSYGRETRGEEKDRKLLFYLAREGHWSPFEFIEFVFHVKAPIFVARQWMRHRIAAYAETSLRYVEATPEDWYAPFEGRVQDTVNKQASSGRPFFLRLREEWDDEARERIKNLGEWHDVVTEEINAAHADAWRRYEHLLKIGVAREQARSVLPVGMNTVFHCKINGRSLFNFLHLRDHDAAQVEIRMYARAILKLIERTQPLYVKAYRDHYVPMHSRNNADADS